MAFRHVLGGDSRASSFAKTTEPVVYDDLLAELCASKTQELSHGELAALVSRPEDQVLAALEDLEVAGLVHYLEHDLNHPDLLDRWSPADTLQHLRISAWLDDAVFDLSDDIELSSELAHDRHHAPNSSTAHSEAEARF